MQHDHSRCENAGVKLSRVLLVRQKLQEQEQEQESEHDLV